MELIKSENTVNHNLCPIKGVHMHSVGLFGLKIIMPTMLLFARAAHCQIFSSPEKLNYIYVCLLNLVRTRVG